MYPRMYSPMVSVKASSRPNVLAILAMGGCITAFFLERKSEWELVWGRVLGGRGKGKVPFTTSCTTYTVATSECFLKALVANTVRFSVVWDSSDVQTARRKILTGC